MKHLNSVRIDASILEEVGLGPLEPKQARAALESIRSDLDRRIVSRLTPAMSVAQRREFESLRGEATESAVEHFLDCHFPGHRQVAAEELADLKADLSACAAIDRALSGVLPVYHDAFVRLDAAAGENVE
jgi:Protein of unknown function (DUF5663)